MARSEDEGLFKEEISSSEETTLVSREISLGHSSSRGGPRISTSSVNQCRGPKRLSIVPSNVPGSSVGANTSCSDIRQKSQKYLMKSCCLCIKCTATNSLVALM